MTAVLPTKKNSPGKFDLSDTKAVPDTSENTGSTQVIGSPEIPSSTVSKIFIGQVTAGAVVSTLEYRKR